MSGSGFCLGDMLLGVPQDWDAFAFNEL